jgi:hypothetical protein
MFSAEMIEESVALPMTAREKIRRMLKYMPNFYISLFCFILRVPYKVGLNGRRILSKRIYDPTRMAKLTACYSLLSLVVYGISIVAIAPQFEGFLVYSSINNYLGTSFLFGGIVLTTPIYILFFFMLPYLIAG